MIYYYLTISPLEALIASELNPQEFGSYMATGSRKGSAEQLIFMEVEGGFSSYFDWDYAADKCVSHTDGNPKHSLYLSIYRVLEFIPLEKMKNIYLTTKDGRTLPLEKRDYADPEGWSGYALYKELCPVTPLVVSTLKPKHFGEHLVSKAEKINVPSVVFSDVKMIDLDDIENTGNIGQTYSLNTEHLKSCITDLQAGRGKMTKTVDRSFNSRFSYQAIGTGIYVSNGEQTILYPMPTVDELKKIDYDWARSAMII